MELQSPANAEAARLYQENRREVRILGVRRILPVEFPAGDARVSRRRTRLMHFL
jgi:hypothetical protein